MKAELVPLNGDPPIPVVRDVTVVGRRDYCDVRIDDPSLSRRHCVIVRTDGLLMIRDLATTNGTKVNGQRVMWAALLPNDKLTIGAYKVRVYLGPDDQPSPSEQHPSRSQPVVPIAPRVPEDRPVRGEFPTPTPEPFVPATPAKAAAPKKPTRTPPLPDDDDVLRLSDGGVLNLADLDD